MGLAIGVETLMAPRPEMRLPSKEMSAEQVWSLTQLYSVDFSKSWIGVKSAFSTNAQLRFALVVLDGVLGPSRLARHI